MIQHDPVERSAVFTEHAAFSISQEAKALADAELRPCLHLRVPEATSGRFFVYCLPNLALCGAHRAFLQHAKVCHQAV